MLVGMSDEIGQNTAWYYCLKHHSVETEGECKATDRLGPYPSPEAAAQRWSPSRSARNRIEAEDRAWAEAPPATPGPPSPPGRQRVRPGGARWSAGR